MTQQAAPLVAFVNDEPAICLLARRVLELAGFRVLVGSDGQDAVQLRFGEPEPDAMFVNGAMRVMSGPDAIRCIRERERVEGRRRLPIALQTAWFDHRKIAAECGADTSLGCPFGPPELVAAAQSLLTRRA